MHNIANFEALLRKTLYGFVQRLENSSNKIIATLIKSWTVRFVDLHCWISRLYTWTYVLNCYMIIIYKLVFNAYSVVDED